MGPRENEVRACLWQYCHQLPRRHPKINTIHTLLGQLYDDVRKQLITTRMPAHCNCSQQEEEIVCHFAGMWDDKQYDVSHLPASIPNTDDLFMPEEPYMPGAMVHYQPDAEEMGEDHPEEAPTMVQNSDMDSESDDNDNGAMTVQKSTDAEIRDGTVSILI